MRTSLRASVQWIVSEAKYHRRNSGDEPGAPASGSLEAPNQAAHGNAQSGAHRAASDEEHLGARLQAFRLAAGLSVREAGRRCRLSDGTLRKIESLARPNPNLTTLLVMMEVYGAASIDHLLGPSAAERTAYAWRSLAESPESA